MNDFYHVILQKLKNNIDVVLISLIHSLGSTPRKAGAKMAYFSDNTTVGTIGGGAIEYDCTKKAEDILSTKTACTKSYTLTHNDKCDIGMVCGGNAQIYFQYISSNVQSIELISHICSLIDRRTPSHLITKISDDSNAIGTFDKENGLKFITIDESKKLLLSKTPTLIDNIYTEPLVTKGCVYIFGGGHVSRALVPMLYSTDFDVVVYEDNKDFLIDDAFLNAKEKINAKFTEINEHINITEDDYCVILTRGHSFDNEVLSQILSKNPSYIGVIGSKKKVESMQNYLYSCEFSKEQVERIHSPIGIEINAQTPAEIAVSITAQLINHRAKNK